ncbi:GNAT family N-acetyltransferase [Polyangium jinanense]|uniref:GNAT family N-acetyltransferase n=1 Tax=Polyangium jinanense TaxID=2829994 RepID=A0A9X3X0R1_9BACT|nr:GNAT family N-acetyltransferase [Polyangium jinanense]MDC3955328.1 GNAT family N-acetyltransferase [Polyangium jinanense]MDC3981629.1 GNAT family N-acetyltransferase [Polyangium jinanense]
MIFRDARRDDVPTVVHLLAADALGATRETTEGPLPDGYYQAFEAIERDPNNRLVVVEDGGAVIGCLQLTYIPGLTYQGGLRMIVEGVRVAESHRGAGIGRRMLTWAIEEARARGCRLVQLTTNKARTDAKRFYESLGFTASHEGMKLDLT